jgi:hypothetical protein
MGFAPFHVVRPLFGDNRGCPDTRWPSGHGLIPGRPGKLWVSSMLENLAESSCLHCFLQKFSGLLSSG